MKEENQNGKERQMAEEQIDFRTNSGNCFLNILFTGPGL